MTPAAPWIAPASSPMDAMRSGDLEIRTCRTEGTQQYTGGMPAPPPVFQATPSDLSKSTMTAMCPRCGYAGAFATASHVVMKNVAGGAAYAFAMRCLHCRSMVLADVQIQTNAQMQTSRAAVLAVYPRLGRVFPFEGLELLPVELRGALQETYRALEAGAVNLTGLGCRVVLERLVQGLGHRDSSPLEARLEKLRDTHPDMVGPLVNADLVRLVGNVAAHDAYREITAEEAMAILEFTEEILRAVYIAPAKSAQMRKAFEKKRDAEAV